MNKKGDMSILLLVILVLLVCIISLFTFITKSNKWGIEISNYQLIDGVYVDELKLEFYFNYFLEKSYLTSYFEIVNLRKYSSNNGEKDIRGKKYLEFYGLSSESELDNFFKNRVEANFVNEIENQKNQENFPEVKLIYSFLTQGKTEVNPKLLLVDWNNKRVSFSIDGITLMKEYPEQKINLAYNFSLKSNLKRDSFGLLDFSSLGELRNCLIEKKIEECTKNEFENCLFQRSAFECYNKPEFENYEIKILDSFVDDGKKIGKFVLEIKSKKEFLVQNELKFLKFDLVVF